MKAQLSNIENNGQMTNEQMRISFREKENEYENNIRQLKRQLEEALFMVDKAKKESEFTTGLLRGENDASLKLLRENLARVEG